jgi:hypothetical protein
MQKEAKAKSRIEPKSFRHGRTIQFPTRASDHVYFRVRRWDIIFPNRRLAFVDDIPGGIKHTHMD